MIQLGKYQDLYIVNKKDFGVYLNDEADSTEGSILLPIKQVPEDNHMGDQIHCFIYKDSEDRPIATTNTPRITLGEIAPLTVKEVTDIGAFLDWGLEKDLFLPFGEQLCKVKEGGTYLFSLYVDKSERLCATMKIGQLLATDHSYEKDQWVKATIYNLNPDLGAFVAVDDKYLGRVPKQELHGKLAIGQPIDLRITAIDEEGKMTLSPREKAYIQMDADAQIVMDAIDSYDGVLPFNDKARPEVIDREVGMSKNAFKRAVGHLLKAKKIQITDKSIRKL